MIHVQSRCMIHCGHSPSLLVGFSFALLKQSSLANPRSVTTPVLRYILVKPGQLVRVPGFGYRLPSPVAIVDLRSRRTACCSHPLSLRVGFSFISLKRSSPSQIPFCHNTRFQSYIGKAGTICWAPPALAFACPRVCNCPSAFTSHDKLRSPPTFSCGLLVRLAEAACIPLTNPHAVATRFCVCTHAQDV